MLALKGEVWWTLLMGSSQTTGGNYQPAPVNGYLPPSPAWKLYICPLDYSQTGNGNMAEYIGRQIKFCSYTMAEGVNNNGRLGATGSNKYTSIKQDCILLWQSDQTDGGLNNGSYFNDGVSPPDSQGMGKQHGHKGATVGVVDGHVEYMIYSTW